MPRTPKSKILSFPGGGHKLLLALVLLIFAIGFFYVISPVEGLVSSAIGIKTQLDQVSQALDNGDLDEIQIRVRKLEEQIQMTRGYFERLKYFKAIPVLNQYYQEGERVFRSSNYALSASSGVLAALVPYQQNFNIRGNRRMEQIINEAVAESVEKSPELISALENAARNLDLVSREINGIELYRYPEKLFGFKLRLKLIDMQAQLVDLQNFLSQFSHVE